ncbi:MAG: CDP-diacylglycerol--glycerol-3-phosphate 3-phosphatidyltransferase [Oscillospiraceae bacterium]
MNVPNQLTLVRILLIPFFIMILLMPSIPFHYLIALIIFILASFTDFLDGYLARKHSLITDFGKLMDPLADKLLVTAALICFVELGLVSSVAVIIIISREFLVTSIRLIAAGKGNVLAADKWGKYKTVLQMVTIIVILLGEHLKFVQVIPVEYSLRSVYNLFIYMTVFLTLSSGINYIIKNKEIFNDK